MKRIIVLIVVASVVLCFIPATAMGATTNDKDVMTALEKDTDDGMNMYENSDFIEKEQPELSDETKELISLYQRDPTKENYFNLRDMVMENYNAVLDRKEEKLAELKIETAGKPGGGPHGSEERRVGKEWRARWSPHH